MMLNSSCYGVWLEGDALNLGGWDEEVAKGKTFIFKFFIQKKNIGLTHMLDRGYILWSLYFPP